MVRVKHRYLVCKLYLNVNEREANLHNSTSSSSKSLVTSLAFPTENNYEIHLELRDLHRAIRSILSLLYGDYGIALSTPIQIRFYDNITRIVILRVPIDGSQMIYTALSLISLLPLSIKQMVNLESLSSNGTKQEDNDQNLEQIISAGSSEWYYKSRMLPVTLTGLLIAGGSRTCRERVLNILINEFIKYWASQYHIEKRKANEKTMKDDKISMSQNMTVSGKSGKTKKNKLSNIYAEYKKEQQQEKRKNTNGSLIQVQEDDIINDNEQVFGNTEDEEDRKILFEKKNNIIIYAQQRYTKLLNELLYGLV